MANAADCRHEDFHAVVKVGRILDAGKFIAEIEVRCTQCDEPFRFVGAPAGLSYERPSCSIDGLTLLAPIEPEIEKQLHASARYEVPAIPQRH